ncbi:MAG: BamA/TamA family outer membrane protein [Gammaproteobacteria bacterium]|nr:BamA/TamA family outer membrane protein [Gammaproteobacteria bacterium]
MQIRKSSPVSLHALLLGATLALTAVPLPALDILDSAPERRSEQFPTDNAYLLVPLPYSMPGIGEGYFLMGYFSNMFGTTADGFITRVGGDAEGWVTQFDEVPLYKKTLFFNVMDQRISKAAVNNYKSRGMNTGKDDYNIVEVNQADERHLGLTLSLFERRLEFTSSHNSSNFALTYIRDKDGNVISAFAPPYRQESSSWLHGLTLDLTDDHQDPRKGLRLGLSYRDNPAQTANDPDFYTLDTSLSLYLPVFSNDTVALNYYQSDANVTREGQTDPTAIRTELGFNCDPLDSSCLQAEQEIVDSFILQRSNGTATSLGGNDRLRSYPRGRFYGSHMAFLGVEYRMNFAREAKPFNYFIWKDVTTSLQLAFFAETGTVAEASSGLWQEQRTSYGIGGRLLSASGSVYRADYAVGDEGSEVTLFFYYPW